MTEQPKLPPHIALRERLQESIDAMDKRTRFSREVREILSTAEVLVRDHERESDAAVQQAFRERDRATQLAADLERGRDSALEALKVRQSGGEAVPGEPVVIESPRGANSRDWTLSEVEEACYRIRVAGCVDDTRLRLSLNCIQATIPPYSSLPPSKAELTFAEEERRFQASQRRTARVKRWRSRVLIGVPSVVIGVPLSLAVLNLAWRATTYLLGQF